MRDLGFVVRGRGKAESLMSAAHGAGRQFSRQQAFKRLDWKDVDMQLKKHGVDLISASLDETPGAYKDIRHVMEAQADLVDVVAEFQPLLVKMDSSGKNYQRKKGKKKASDKRERKRADFE